MTDLVVARNCCMANGVGINMSARWGGGAKSVKLFERPNGLDSALYENYI